MHPNEELPSLPGSRASRCRAKGRQCRHLSAQATTELVLVLVLAWVLVLALVWVSVPRR